MRMNKSAHENSGNDVFCQNRECPYFPCHKGADPETFNCKHCYCPLYFIYEDDCGGTFVIRDNGIKDCSACLVPHEPGGHDYIVGKLRAYFNKVKQGRV